MRKVHRTFVTTAAIAGGLAVAAGAFGSHILEDTLSEHMLEVFQTGVEYQMYHALALLASAWAYTRWHSRYARISGWAFLTGIVVFSGSLYLLSLTGIRWIGAVTPIGGVAFIVGWIALALSPRRRRDE